MDPLKVSSDSPSSLLSLKASFYLICQQIIQRMGFLLQFIAFLPLLSSFYLSFLCVGLFGVFFGLVWFGFFK